MAVKTLIVGDIHGCWSEFQALLDRSALSADDQIISVGDMVDRGPDSPRVLEFFRDAPNARAIMGNHEMKHIQAARGEKSASKPELITKHQFGDGYDGGARLHADAAGLRRTAAGRSGARFLRAGGRAGGSARGRA